MWNSRMDAKLLKLRKRGLSYADAAERMGVTRNAAMARGRRLSGRKFPSEKLRDERNRKAVKQRALQKARREKIVADKLRMDIKSGIAKPLAIRRALANGATYRVIGSAIGLSRQRVHQIMIETSVDPDQMTPAP